MKRKLIAIVPAAGQGLRAGTGLPKQYRHIAGVPMLRLSVQALLAEPRIAAVRVAIAPGDAHAAPALAGLPRTVWRACGGATRAHTVRAALQDALDDAALQERDWVLVHDAARPGLPPCALARLVDSCLHHDSGGLLALPVADSVKRATVADAVADTPVRIASGVSRDGLWLAQTPQMFIAGDLFAALADARPEAITDEASAMERMGHAPLLVQGSMRNFKVTWPEDFDLMAKWLD